MLLVLCIGRLCINVSATQLNDADIPNNISSEIDEISSALSSSNTLKGYLSTKISVFDSETDNESEISRYTTNNEIYDSTLNESRIKVYSILLENTTQSIYSNISENNDIWIVAKDIDSNVSFSFLKKGEDISAATDKINALSVSDSYKSRMLQKAIERANKWYVAYVEKQNTVQNARDFISESNIESLLAENEVGNIIDTKYIYIQNNNMLAISVKTSDSEYVIPYVTATRSDNMSNNSIYTVSEMKDFILND